MGVDEVGQLPLDGAEQGPKARQRLRQRLAQDEVHAAVVQQAGVGGRRQVVVVFTGAVPCACAANAARNRGTKLTKAGASVLPRSSKLWLAKAPGRRCTQRSRDSTMRALAAAAG